MTIRKMPKAIWAFYQIILVEMQSQRYRLLQLPAGGIRHGAVEKEGRVGQACE